jgi:hypothetical protein
MRPQRAAGTDGIRHPLDFLPRPARMTRRQHSGTGFSRDEESPFGAAIAPSRGICIESTKARLKEAHD